MGIFLYHLEQEIWRKEDNVRSIESSPITHKLTQMRRKECGTKDFRENLDEIAELMAYEVCRDLPTNPIEIEHRLRSVLVMN